MSWPLGRSGEPGGLSPPEADGGVPDPLGIRWVGDPRHYGALYPYPAQHAQDLGQKQMRV